jgi:sugar phosphate isomerase/epimerase
MNAPWRVGIGMHSYGARKFPDAASFLRHAASLGAAGVQVRIGVLDAAAAKELRAFAESKGLYLEGQVSLPKAETDWERWEEELRTAAAAGATVLRTALHGGRRYEVFERPEDFDRFQDFCRKALERAEPLLRRHGLKLAVENHKDLLVPEMIAHFRRISSEHVGACVDTGNSLALLEDPMEVAGALAPWALAAHLKDMAVAECPDGFLLSEIPLGRGSLDLVAIGRTLLKARPGLNLSIEMITRDPLRIPCLTERYWTTLRDLPAAALARTLAFVKRRSTPEALPRVHGLTAEQRIEYEEANVRACLEWGRNRE